MRLSIKTIALGEFVDVYHHDTLELFLHDLDNLEELETYDIIWIKKNGRKICSDLLPVPCSRGLRAQALRAIEVRVLASLKESEK